MQHSQSKDGLNVMESSMKNELILQNERKFLLEDTFDIAPAGLTFCFDREQFLNDDFNSDEFILDYRDRGLSLEKLRDSLLQYSNILKSSLVELINQDYADFVNLSTNLVGLDKAISLIASPLNCLRSSVLSILEDLDSVNTQLSFKLKEREEIRKKKEIASSLLIMDGCITRLERWLGSSQQDFLYNIDSSNLSKSELVSQDLQSQSNELSEWPSQFYADCSLHEDIGQRMERIANEYIKLQFFTKKCKDHPAFETFKSRIHYITLTLQKQLESQLKASMDACGLLNLKEESIPKNATERLRHVISTYMAIDKLPDLMMIYRQYILRPQLCQIFVPNDKLSHGFADLQESSEIVNDMYKNALHVLERQLSLLHKFVFERPSESFDPISEFDCLVDGFWPETVDLMFKNLPVLFSPGNPDRFYVFYTNSMHFVEQIEAKVDSSEQLLALRNHASYQNFMSKWSLPVYFQIRFQDIASCLEDAINAGLVLSKPNEEGGFLHVTVVTQTQLSRCWQDGIYLDCLKHRFWKLTLQLLSRYTNFVKNQLADTSDIETSPNASALDQSPSQTKKQSSNSSFPERMIFLLVDCFRLVDFTKSVLMKFIFSRLQSILNRTVSDSSTCESVLSECLNESCGRLLETTDPLRDHIATQLQSLCQTANRQILDIPRQYRRTNREYPLTASSYLSTIIDPLERLSLMGQKFTEQYPSAQSKLESLVQESVKQVSQTFHTELNEVLTTVRKMEDSVRRLREVRRFSNLPNNSGPANGLYTDDDKIRHQLYLDACAFRDKVITFWGINADCMTQLQRCVELTESAKSASGTSGD